MGTTAVDAGDAFLTWAEEERLDGPARRAFTGPVLPDAGVRSGGRILFTSATTGRPSGAVLSHRAHVHIMMQAAPGTFLEPASSSRGAGPGCTVGVVAPPRADAHRFEPSRRAPGRLVVCPGPAPSPDNNGRQP